jgi:hypothetical protein
MLLHDYAKLFADSNMMHGRAPFHHRYKFQEMATKLSYFAARRKQKALNKKKEVTHG